MAGTLRELAAVARDPALDTPWALRCPVGMGAADVLDIYQMTELSDLHQELQDAIRAAAPNWSRAVSKR